MDKKGIIEIAKSSGGFVVEYEDKYRYFKNEEDLIKWGKFTNVYSWVPCRDEKDGGKIKMMQNFEEVNFIAYYDNERNIKTENF